MKRILLFLLCLPLLAAAQNQSPYTFTITHSADRTDVKDQAATGTCWTFATNSFIESELLRMGKGQHDISEMFNVRVTYPEKAWFYVRAGGKTQFGPGSLGHDVINAIRLHGMVPESAYPGKQGGSGQHDHSELDAVLEAFVKPLAERQNLSEFWVEAFEGILNAYLGEIPESFSYQGKTYTPQQFREAMGINPDDYVNITSFSHRPFYQKMVLEVPDNFSRGTFDNVGIEELYQIAVYALENGFTVSWDADVSEPGFSFTEGLAILPEKGTLKADLFIKPVAEKEVDQESRQQGYNSHATTDDHLMHLVGLAKDQNGALWFVMKNSWGTGNKGEGYQYVSEAYFKMKTIAITLHKDGLPKELRKKLGY